MCVDRADRGAASIRLLQVVADDLLELAQPLPGRALEPTGEALVQVGGGALRKRPIRGIANQGVPEPVCLVAREVGEVGPNHVPANKIHQTELESRLERVGSEIAHRATMEHRPLDGGRGDDRPLVGRQSLDAGGEQRLDRRGHRKVGEVGRHDPVVILPGQQLVVDQHRHHLLGEERVTLHGLGDPRLGLRRERCPVEQVRDQLPGLLVAEWLEQDRRRVQLAPAPVGTCVEQLGPRDADQQDRDVARDRARRARPGRGTSAPPSGRRRTRPPAGRCERAPRRAFVPPRRSPHSFLLSGPPSPSAAAMRSAINSAFSSPASRAAIATDCSPGSWPSARATSFTTSASGQYVMPSP